MFNGGFFFLKLKNVRNNSSLAAFHSFRSMNTRCLLNVFDRAAENKRSLGSCEGQQRPLVLDTCLLVVQVKVQQYLLLKVLMYQKYVFIFYVNVLLYCCNTFKLSSAVKKSCFQKKLTKVKYR